MNTSFKRTPCKIKYKQLTNISKYNANNYFYVGDDLIYNPGFLTRKEENLKKKFYANKLDVDLHSGISAINSRCIENLSLKRSNILKNIKKQFFTLTQPLYGKKDNMRKIYGCSSLENKIDLNNLSLNKENQSEKA